MILDEAEVQRLISKVVADIVSKGDQLREGALPKIWPTNPRLYPIAYSVGELMNHEVVLDVNKADIIIGMYPENNVLIPVKGESPGISARIYTTLFPPKSFKKNFMFHWEKSSREALLSTPGYSMESGLAGASLVLSSIPFENPMRTGLIETPFRMAKAMIEMNSGYMVDPEKVMTLFPGEGADEIILLKDIPFTSTCEHHLLPFMGKAHVAYLPKNHIVGVSKLARLVKLFANRLQTQERIGTQVSQTLNKLADGKGAACIIEASHTCMACRGVNVMGATMTTSALVGSFRNPEVKSELIALIR